MSEVPPEEYHVQRRSAVSGDWEDTMTRVFTRADFAERRMKELEDVETLKCSKYGRQPAQYRILVHKWHAYQPMSRVKTGELDE